MEPFIGQIMLFGGNFAPRGWAFCNGQLLSISANSALFAILGTTYGGDGRTTFALPDLRGRTPVGFGNGAGLSNIKLGQKGGTETHTLSILEMPSHNHDGSTLTAALGCNEEDGVSDEASGHTFGNAASGTPYNTNANDSTVGSITVGGSTGLNGGNRAFNMRNPYLGANYVIALQGIFPSRS